MEIKIEIPKEFEEHFNIDRFSESLERVRVEISLSENVMTGLYELELIQMLRKTMTNAEVVKE